MNLKGKITNLLLTMAENIFIKRSEYTSFKSRHSSHLALYNRTDSIRVKD